MKQCIRYSRHLTLLALINIIAYSYCIRENSLHRQTKVEENFRNVEISYGSDQLVPQVESRRYEGAAIMFDVMNDGLNRKKRQTELMDLGDTKETESVDDAEEDGFWTRVARVALNILKKFMAWLND